jgi:hypothetical protein
MRFFLMATIVLTLLGCGDREKVAVYKQGEYQGKTDAAPWNNTSYNGDKAKWEGDIRARGRQQDESRRTGG